MTSPTPEADPAAEGSAPSPTPLPVPVAKKAAPVPAKNLAFPGAEPGVLVIVGVSLVIAGALVLTTFRRRPE